MCYPPNFNHNLNLVAHYSLDKVKDGSVIYVWNIVWRNFVLEEIPKIKSKFKVIFSGQDFIFPYLTQRQPHLEFVGYVDELLSKPYLQGIYAVNCDYIHPKVFPIPIGIPRSMPFVPNGVKDWIGWTCDLWRYDDIVTYFNSCTPTSIMEKMRVKKNSDKLLYASYTSCNSGCHHEKCNPGAPNYQPHTRIRHRLDKYLEKAGFKKSELTQWYEFISDMSQYKFVMSPPGTGPDVYRTAEGILTGTIPILIHCPKSIESLWKTLPVLVIDSFEEINPENLEEQYKRISSRNDYDFSILTTEYWRRKLRE
jgi:hypothetical protein